MTPHAVVLWASVAAIAVVLLLGGFEIVRAVRGVRRLLRRVDAYDITGYPETFIVGRDGIIRKKLMQATDWNSPDARALMDRLLAEQTE